jgi:hypothetical protein
MGEARERVSAEQRDRDRHADAAHAAPAAPNALMAARGAAFEPYGNRALLALLRSGRLQRKPRLSQPGDRFEQQADRDAEAIVAGWSSIDAAPTRGAHRATEIQAQSQPGPLAAPLSLGGGRSLDGATRALMERHFGESFAGVRVHTGHRAADAAAAVEARAFTYGRDIVFGDGEYAPHTPSGLHLLAHELAHVVQQSERGAPAMQRQPAEGGAAADRPVLTRVRRSDIASYGKPPPGWYAQFAPQRPPVDPAKLSIKEAQKWVTDLEGFTREEARRFKIDELLRSMIERLPAEVYLPTNQVIGRYRDAHSSLIVTGTTDAISTENLRNKLFTIYLNIYNPTEFKKQTDPTSFLPDEYRLIWGSAFGIDPFTLADQQPGSSYMPPEEQPFAINTGGFTQREVNILEFLFEDEMLDWRRRAVEVAESVDREHDRRVGVFMGALGDTSIRFWYKSLWFSFKTGATMGVGGAFANTVAEGAGFAGGLSSAPWLARIGIAGPSFGTVGAGIEATDAALSNLPDVVRGDISASEYGGRILGGAKSGFVGGYEGGVLGEAASPLLRPIFKFFLPDQIPSLSTAPDVMVPTSPVATPRGDVAAPKPPVLAPRPDVAPSRPPPVPEPEPFVPSPSQPPATGLRVWMQARMRDILTSLRLSAEPVLPKMDTGYARGSTPTMVEPGAPATVPDTPAPTVSTPRQTGAVAPTATVPAPADAASVPTGAPVPSVGASVPSAAAVPAQAAQFVPGALGAAVIATDVQPAPSEAVRRVQLVERMQQLPQRFADMFDDAVARGDAATLGLALYPSEVAHVLRGGPFTRAYRGVFVEWQCRLAFAQDPLIQPHIQRGGYLGYRYVVGRGFRRGFADFSGTPNGLLSGLLIDITTEQALAAHLARGYLEKGLVLTYR